MNGILTTLALSALLSLAPLVSFAIPAWSQETGDRNTDTAGALEAHKRSVFRIFAISSRGMMSGSGFLISEHGWVATNRHVINHANAIYVSILSERGNSAKLYAARLIKDDIDHDLAILQLLTIPMDLPEPFNISVDMPKVFDEVIAIGFPAALDQPISELADFSENVITDPTILENLEPNLTKGAISKVGSWVIHDAKIGAGSSGGPLVDARNGCTVVGINTARTMGGTSFYMAVPPDKLMQLYVLVDEADKFRSKMESCVAQGDYHAMCYLGERLCYGKDGYPHHVERGLTLLENAADAGVEDAHLILGILYSEGKQVNYDIRKSLEHLGKVRSLQSALLRFKIYAYGEEGAYEPQPEMAFQVASDMRKDYPDSVQGTSCLATCYQYGIGTKRDIRIAIELRKSILDRLIEDDPRGEFLSEEFSLGKLLLLSDDQADRERGIELLRLHAEHKDYETCGMACHALAVYYGPGKGQRTDWQKHVHYLRIGAEVKDPVSLANLAIAYAQGRGVPFDIETAVSLANEAVERGCNEGVYAYIGSAYIEAGREALGLEYMNRALAAGSAVAQCKIAVFHLFGEHGFKKDKDKAVTLLRQAAKNRSDPHAAQTAQKLLQMCTSSAATRSSAGTPHPSPQGKKKNGHASEKSSPSKLPKRSSTPW